LGREKNEYCVCDITGGDDEENVDIVTTPGGKSKFKQNNLLDTNK